MVRDNNASPSDLVPQRPGIACRAHLMLNLPHPSDQLAARALTQVWLPSGSALVGAELVVAGTEQNAEPHVAAVPMAIGAALSKTHATVDEGCLPDTDIHPAESARRRDACPWGLDPRCHEHPRPKLLRPDARCCDAVECDVAQHSVPDASHTLRGSSPSAVVE